MPGCIVVPVVLVEFCNLIVDVIIDVTLWYRACKWGDMVVPSFANSSAFSFPQMPVWAAIHLSSRVLVVPR